MVAVYDIANDEIALLIKDGKYITGYTTIGGYDPELGQVKVKREILPAYFFDNFVYGRYLYYSKPEEVIEDKNYIPPQTDSVEVESKQNTVPKEQYDSLKEELELLKKQQESMMEMIHQLLGQKG